MGEVIVTPPRVREEEVKEKKVENQTEETQEEIQQEEQPIESSEEQSETKEEEMNSSVDGIKEKVQEVKETISEKTSEIKSKVNRPWIWMLAGAGLILALLICTNHLVWTSDGPQLVTMSDAYQAGIQRGIKNIEALPWYSRVWRGFTGDYHSK